MKLALLRGFPPQKITFYNRAVIPFQRLFSCTRKKSTIVSYQNCNNVHVMEAFHNSYYILDWKVKILLVPFIHLCAKKMILLN